MGDAIVVSGLGKQFRRSGVDRPASLKEAVLNGWRRTSVPQFWGLRNINFSVPRGRTIGVVGKNGAGKSTLLRLIGGVGRPDEGSVRVNGRIGALLDLHAGLTDDLTGRENIFILGVIAGMTRAEVQARFDEIVEFAELEDFVNAPIRVYSSGMRMRLAFAVAAHIEPDILLIDEVLAVGDDAFQRKCLERINRFKAEGCTIVLVSHESAKVRALCDEVLLLKQGHMLDFGPTEEVMKRYENLLEERRKSVGTSEEPSIELSNGHQLSMGINRFGSQEVQIESVRLLSLQGSATSCIASGTGLIVEFDYCAKIPASSPKASVGIYLPTGTACYDTNTSLGGLQMPTLDGRGTLRLRIERLDLVGGEYFVNVGLYEKDWEYAYDAHLLVYPLSVVGAGTGTGIIYPPARWDIAVQHPTEAGREGASALGYERTA